MGSSNWESAPLGEVLEPIKRLVTIQPEEQYTTLGVRWYGKGPFKKPPLAGTAIAAKALNQVRSDDVVYSKLFAWKGSFGCILEELDGCYASNEFPTYVADPERLLPEYFALWASRTQVWDEADLMSTGTTANSRNRLAPEDFLAMEIDLPPLEDQRTAVRLINHVDAAASLANRTARAFDEFFIAYRQDLFGRLTDEYPAVSIEDFAAVSSGGTPSRRHPEYFGGDVPWVKTAEVAFGAIDSTEECITEAGLANSSAKLFPASTVLVAMYGRGTVGRSAYITRPMATNQACAAIKPGPMHSPLFLFHFLWSAYQDLVEEAEGTTNLTNISLGVVGGFEVPLPPVDVQEQIAAELELLVTGRRRHQALVQAHERFRSALIDDVLGDGLNGAAVGVG